MVEASEHDLRIIDERLTLTSCSLPILCHDGVLASVPASSSERCAFRADGCCA